MSRSLTRMPFSVATRPRYVVPAVLAMPLSTWSPVVAGRPCSSILPLLPALTSPLHLLQATSGINGSGTASQAAQDIHDNSKIFFDDTKKSAAELARDPLIRVLTYKSGSAVDWLEDKFALDLTRVSRLGGHSHPRTHRGPAQFPGMEITMALMNKAEDIAASNPERLTILKKATVTKLLYENDAVAGAEYQYDGTTHRISGPVILATGGYAADFSTDSLLKEFKPEWMDLPTTNGAHCTGDGQKMVRAIGGSLIDMEKVQVHPTGLLDPAEPDAKVKFLAAEALRGVGGLMLDNEGNRFVDELEKRAVVTAAMWKHNKFPIRLVLNGAASAEIDWHCKHYAARGLMKRYETYQDVAKDMKISADHLAKTLDDYQKIAASNGKIPDPFGKKFHKNFEKIREGPFYVAIVVPVLHYTMGGVEINDQAQIMLKGPDASEKVVPGLFAAGEIAGGVHGANRLGGSSLLGCVVYGRVAGDSASAYLLEGYSKGKTAAGRLEQVANQLETRIKVNPADKSVNLSFHWDDQSNGGQGGSTGSGPSVAAPAPAPAEGSSAAPSAPPTEKKDEPAKPAVYTMDEVAKHKSVDDVWVVVEGKVLDVTKFLPDHPGGTTAVMKYAGTDCTEAFLMLHDPNVIGKYAPYTVIGTVQE